jgi:hypothetical protein
MRISDEDVSGSGIRAVSGEGMGGAYQQGPSRVDENSQSTVALPDVYHDSTRMSDALWMRWATHCTTTLLYFRGKRASSHPL